MLKCFFICSLIEYIPNFNCLTTEAAVVINQAYSVITERRL